MPKLNFQKPNNFYRQDNNGAENCAPLEVKVRKLYDLYKGKLTLQESQTLLFIARTILANNKRLPEHKRHKFHTILNNLLEDCKRR